MIAVVSDPNYKEVDYAFIDFTVKSSYRFEPSTVYLMPFGKLELKVLEGVDDDQDDKNTVGQAWNLDLNIGSICSFVTHTQEYQGDRSSFKPRSTSYLDGPVLIGNCWGEVAMSGCTKMVLLIRFAEFFLLP